MIVEGNPRKGDILTKQHCITNIEGHVFRGGFWASSPNNNFANLLSTFISHVGEELQRGRGRRGPSTRTPRARVVILLILPAHYLQPLVTPPHRLVKPAQPDRPLMFGVGWWQAVMAAPAPDPRLL